MHSIYDLYAGMYTNKKTDEIIYFTSIISSQLHEILMYLSIQDLGKW